MGRTWRDVDEAEQAALWAHHDAVTRHFDRTVTAGFLDEMDAWLGSWFDAPAGYDTEHLVAARTDAQMVRMARCMRWAIDHIRQRDPDMRAFRVETTTQEIPTNG